MDDTLAIQSATTAEERMARLERFIEFWVGPREPEYGEPEEALARAALPRPLERLYRFAGRWRPDDWPAIPNSPPHIFCVQDELSALSSLRLSPDGKLVFIRENQSCWSAATDPTGDDPPVWIKQNSEAPAQWTLACDSLSRFLVTFCLQELLFGSRFVLSGDDETEPLKPQLDQAVPIWVEGPYAYSSDYNFYLMAPDALVLRLNDDYIISANTDRAVALLKSQRDTIRRIVISTPNGWQLQIGSDGSGSIMRLRSQASGGTIPSGTFDFATLLPRLYTTPGTAKPYGVFHLSFEPKGPGWPVLPSDELQALFAQALGAATDREPMFNTAVREHPLSLPARDEPDLPQPPTRRKWWGLW